MKKLALTAMAVFVSIAAFAQGKILFVNDSLHMVYYSTSGTLLAGDVAGSAVAVNGQSATGQALSVDLFYGTSSSSLSRLSTTTMSGGSGTTGIWASQQLATPAAQSYFFQVQVYATSAGSYAAASQATGLYYGESVIFNTTAGSFAANPLWSQSQGNWPLGTDTVTGNITGGKGAIALQANVPEPTSLALLGLGAAGMLIFRRRK